MSGAPIAVRVRGRAHGVTLRLDAVRVVRQVEVHGREAVASALRVESVTASTPPYTVPVAWTGPAIVVTLAPNEYVRAWPKSGNSGPPKVIVVALAGAAGAG